VGLTFGLQLSRTVTVQFNLQLGKDHWQPHAVKAPSSSFSRKLGILISGKYTCGSQMGDKFEHWIQSDRHKAISKAEKLARKIYAGVENEGLLRTGTNPRGQQPTKLDDWLKDGPTSETERTDIQPHHLGRLHLHPRGATQPTSNSGKKDASCNPEVFAVCLQILRSLKHMVQKRRIRAMESVRKYLIAESTKKLAKRIAKAVRPGVVPLLKHETQRELSRKAVLQNCTSHG
jgi:hypothetical protein